MSARRYVAVVGAVNMDICGRPLKKLIFRDSNPGTLQLTPGDPDEIRARMDECNRARREKQPLNYPSAGSTFKRPAGLFAAKLIDECGLRGLRVGDAQVSEKHAGFIINLGHATAHDILALMDEVRTRVLAQTGVMLEPEVRILGEDRKG